MSLWMEWLTIAKNCKIAAFRHGLEFELVHLQWAQKGWGSAQVQLCIRGHVSSRRGSAIAGIVCGLPIVGYRGVETGFPITEAGVSLVDVHDRDGLVNALHKVLTNEILFLELRQRSAMAAQKYFSWDAIVSQFRSAISSHPSEDSCKPL